MPYKKIEDLPPPIRKYLPEAAQHIFMAAFNANFFKNEHMPFEDREKMAFRVAWGAVKQTYKKDKKTKMWVKKADRKKKKSE